VPKVQIKIDLWSYFNMHPLKKPACADSLCIPGLKSGAFRDVLVTERKASSKNDSRNGGVVLLPGSNWAATGCTSPSGPILQDKGERRGAIHRGSACRQQLPRPRRMAGHQRWGGCYLTRRLDSCDYSRSVITGKGHLDKVSEQHTQTALPVNPVRAV